jgi:hypothetical protein
MKDLKLIYLFVSLLLAVTSKGQITFSMTYSLCEGNTATVTASSGTLSPSSYTWSSNPVGPAFSASSSPHTGITFPGAGTYTILLGATSGTNVYYASNTITVYPNPVVTIASSSSTICAGQSATLTAGGASNYSWEPQPGVFIISAIAGYVSPNITTGYTVSGTSSVGCVGSQSYTLNVDTYPNLGIITTGDTICAGFTSTITVLGAMSYTWSGSTFSGTTSQASIIAGPGSYSVIGSNGGVCADTANIIIAMAAPLTVTASSSRSVICLNSGESATTAVLSASGANTYVWAPYIPGQMSYSLGSTTAVSPSVSTCYTLIASTSNCSVATVLCVNVLTCTSQSEYLSGKRSFQVFPNPAKDHLTVRAQDPVNARLEITDLFGKIIMNADKYFDSTELHLQLEDFLPGIYIMKISPEHEDVQIIRFIKE